MADPLHLRTRNDAAQEVSYLTRKLVKSICFAILTTTITGFATAASRQLNVGKHPRQSNMPATEYGI